MSALVVRALRHITFSGWGTAFPALELDNEEVIRRLPSTFSSGRELDAERIAFLADGFRENSGVSRRAWAHLVGQPLDHANEATSATLGAEALRRALEVAKLDPKELSLVTVATSTPHRMTSTVSADIAARVGADCAAFDSRAGCASSLLALTTASHYVSGGAEHVAVIGAECFSKIIPQDSKVASLSLGDGAGALIVSRGKGSLVSAYHRTDGTLGKLVSTSGALPPVAEDIARGGFVMSGDADELLSAIPGKYEEALASVLRDAAGPIDWYVPHQTSIPLIRKFASRVAAKHAFINVEKHANIGAAGTIVALAEALAAGHIGSGTRVLSAAVGGGMSWGSALYEL